MRKGAIERARHAGDASARAAAGWKSRSRRQAAPPERPEYRCETAREPAGASAGANTFEWRGIGHRVGVHQFTSHSLLTHRWQFDLNERIAGAFAPGCHGSKYYEAPVPVHSDDVDPAGVASGAADPGNADPVNLAPRHKGPLLASPIGSGSAPRRMASASAVGFPSSSLSISPGSSASGARLPFRALTRMRIAGCPARP